MNFKPVYKNVIRFIKDFILNRKPELWIALISLALSIYAVLESSRFNRKTIDIASRMNDETARNFRLSVMPSIIFSTNIQANDPDFDFLGVEIENRGIGPAIIFPPALLLDGKPIGLLDQNPDDVISALDFPKDIFVWKVHNGMTLMPGQKKRIFWSNKDSKEALLYFIKNMERINIVISYTSLYHEFQMFNSQKPNRTNDIFLVSDQLNASFDGSKKLFEPLLNYKMKDKE